MTLDSDGLRLVWERMVAYVAGQLSSHQQNVPVATTTTVGTVKPDGTTITIDADGTISGADTVPIATTSAAGKVIPDGTTIMVDGSGIISTADYGTLIGDLTRRVEELEEALAREVMTYDDGTLIVNSTYDDGTLVTNQGYDDGTLF
jgi:hypothetical protein